MSFHLQSRCGIQSAPRVPPKLTTNPSMPGVISKLVQSKENCGPYKLLKLPFGAPQSAQAACRSHLYMLMRTPRHCWSQLRHGVPLKAPQNARLFLSYSFKPSNQVPSNTHTPIFTMELLAHRLPARRHARKGSLAWVSPPAKAGLPEGWRATVLQRPSICSALPSKTDTQKQCYTLPR